MSEQRVVILVPWREGPADRKKIWTFVKDWWQRDHPDWSIYEGAGPAGPFNRSAAINEAAQKAGDWDVAIVIDADVIANADAVRNGVSIAAVTNQMVVTHDERVMLSKIGTQKILNGFRGSWRTSQMHETVYRDSVSCSVVVSRELWDLVGGFDELFCGWGYEDTAFQISCEALTGKPVIKLTSELFHLWHVVSPETSPKNPTYQANGKRVQRYREARWNGDQVRVLLEEARQAALLVSAPETKIPRIIHRTVPKDTSVEVEGYWNEFQRIHRGWDLRTIREPVDPKQFPITGRMFAKCKNGAQKAGLIRLESVYTHGGIYVDSDVKPYRSFESLLNNSFFAAWEDESVVPDALFGAEPEHPAVLLLIQRAMASIEEKGGAWASGPGVFTEILPGRDDVLLLPPGAFYDVHYLEKADLDRDPKPYEFARHMWHHSWGTEADKKALAAKQRK